MHEYKHKYNSGFFVHKFFFFNYYLKKLTWFIIDIAIQVIPFTKASYTFSSSRFADLVTYKSR